MTSVFEKVAAVYSCKGVSGVFRSAGRNTKIYLHDNITQHQRLVGEYHSLAHQYSPERFSDADPYKLLWVDPDDISLITGEVQTTSPGEYHLERLDSFDHINIGTPNVNGGEWDQTSDRFCDLLVYKAIKTVCENNINWMDTKLFRKHRERIQRGYRSYGCYSMDELSDKAEELNTLIQSIRDSGYLSARKRGDHLLDEIRVNIGRDGNFLYNSEGRHRLSIAKVLRLNQIPVIVVMRHRQWQQLRNELKKSDGKINMDIPEQKWMDHPDLGNILSDNDSVE